MPPAQARHFAARRGRWIESGATTASGIHIQSSIVPQPQSFFFLTPRLYGLRPEAAAQSEGVSLLAHRGDAEADVFLEKDAELFHSFANIVAVDAASECLVFQALFHGVYFQIQDALRRAHVSACGEEAGQLVASKERVLESRLARHAGVVRV